MPVDAHAHLDKYGEDEMESVLAEIADRRMVTVGVSVDEESFIANEGIAARSPWVIPTYGVHPWEAPRHVERLPALAEVARRSPMIGEIGLDHRFVDDEDQFPAQRLLFAALLDIAVEQEKVANIHCSGAERETAEMLGGHGPPRSIVHWYSGPLDDLAPLVELGCLFTIGVEVLRSDHIREIAAALPESRLLAETDNPGGWRWLTGEAGRPHLIDDVLDELAAVRAMEPEAIREVVATNFARLVADDPHLEPWRHLLG